MSVGQGKVYWFGWHLEMLCHVAKSSRTEGDLQTSGGSTSGQPGNIIFVAMLSDRGCYVARICGPGTIFLMTSEGVDTGDVARHSMLQSWRFAWFLTSVQHYTYIISCTVCQNLLGKLCCRRIFNVFIFPGWCWLVRQRSASCVRFRQRQSEL